MIARILDLSVFEVEVEVPVSQLAFLQDVTTINARHSDGYQLDLAFACHFASSKHPYSHPHCAVSDGFATIEAMLANNAIVTVQTTITSPSPGSLCQKMQ